MKIPPPDEDFIITTANCPSCGYDYELSDLSPAEAGCNEYLIGRVTIFKPDNENGEEEK